MAKKKTRKKEPSWTEIGKMAGKKIEKTKPKPWERAFCIHKDEGGGFGRLVFIIAVLYAMNTMQMLPGVSIWTQVAIVIGFALMRF